MLKINYFILILLLIFPCKSYSLMTGESGNYLKLKALQEELDKQKAQTELIKEKKELLENQISDLNKNLIKTAKIIQDNEEILSKLEERIIELQEEREKIKERIKNRDIQLSNLLISLQSIAANPSKIIILSELSPLDNARSVILFKSAAKQIDKEVKALKDDLIKIDILSKDIEEKQDSAAKSSEKLKSEHKKLSLLLSQKKEVNKEAEIELKETNKKTKNLAEKAENLKDLLSKLEEKRKKEEKDKKTSQKSGKILAKDNATVAMYNKRKFTEAKGKLSLPAKGNISLRYGEKDLDGAISKGIKINTRSSAQVISPFDGIVLFSGPFRSYGKMLIIEHAEGYLTLLSGLDNIDVDVGQTLLAGEPIGTMGNTGKQGLYVELRKNKQPVDPEIWMTSDPL